MATITNARAFVVRNHDTHNAGNIISIPATDVVTLAMDFTDVLNSGDAITSTDTVVTVDGAGADAGSSTSLAIDTTAMRATWTPPVLTAASYVVTVTVTTVLGETLTGTGVIQIT